MLVRLGHNGSMFPPVLQTTPASVESEFFHRDEQFRERGSEWVIWSLGDSPRQVSGIGQIHTILKNESSEGCPVPNALGSSSEDSGLNVPPCFIPGSKGSGGHIFFDAFGRSAQERIFPIVNSARP